MKKGQVFQYTSIFVVFTTASVIALLLIQMFFAQVMGNEKNIVVSNINNFFIDHKTLVNPYHIAQALSDYESFKILSCTKLIKKLNDNHEILFLDLSCKGRCNSSKLWLNGIEFKETFTAGNGDLWGFEGAVVASDSIRALFWSFRVFAIIFIVILIGSYRLRVMNLHRKASYRALKDRQRAEIMQNLAHDIKNPLAVIEIATSSNTWEEFLSWKEELTRSVSRIHAIVAGFKTDNLDSSLKIEVDTLDLASIVSDAIKTMESHKFSLNIDSKSDGILLKIDKIALERAIINLVVNAVEAGATQIKVRSQIIGHDLVLCVIDNGPGVPDAIKESLFERGCSFGKAAGQGIGLFNVSSIAKGHKGRAKYQRLDGYSVFEILLPGAVIPKQESRSDESKPNDASDILAKASVLIAVANSARKEEILSELAKFPVKIYLKDAVDLRPSVVFTDDNSLSGKYLAIGVPIILENGKDHPNKVARIINRRVSGILDVPKVEVSVV